MKRKIMLVLALGLILSIANAETDQEYEQERTACLLMRKETREVIAKLPFDSLRAEAEKIMKDANILELFRHTAETNKRYMELLGSLDQFEMRKYDRILQGQVEEIELHAKKENLNLISKTYSNAIVFKKDLSKKEQMMAWSGTLTQIQVEYDLRGYVTDIFLVANKDAYDGAYSRLNGKEFFNMVLPNGVCSRYEDESM